MCSVMQVDNRKMDMLKILRKTTERLECDHCSFRGSDYENIQIHMGTIHPEFCDEMDTAGLGKLIFYQKSAKLFHCHKCFFTSKMYCSVYYHITAHHAMPDKWKEEQKDVLATGAETVKKPLFVEPQKSSPPPESLKPTVSPESQKLAPSEALKPDVGLPSKIPKSISVVSMEQPKVAPVACTEPQKPISVASSELPKPIPVVSSEPSKPVPFVAPEPLKPTPVESSDVSKPVSAISPEPQKPGTVTYVEPQKPFSNVHPELHVSISESEKPAPLVSLEPQKPLQPVSPEPQKSAVPASPPVAASEPQKFAPAVSPEPRRHSPAVSPEPRRHSPAVSPEPRKHSPAVSPEPRRHSPAVSPEPRRHSPAVSPELKKSTSAISSETRRHIPPMRRPASALSPELRKPEPPIPDHWRSAPSIAPDPWRPAPNISHEQQKSSITVSPWSPKPPTSMSMESRRPASEPRRPGSMMSPEPQKFVPEPWKSTTLPESQKSSLVSSEPWKPISSVYPEGWKPVLSPDTWRSSPAVPPSAHPMPTELRKSGPPMSPDLWKPSFFPEQRKPAPVSPDPWKFPSDSRKSPFFSETQKPAPFVSSEFQKRALFSEPRKRALFPESKKSVPPPTSADVQKRPFFHETHMSFPEVQKHALFSEPHRPPPVSPEAQKHAFFPEPQKHVAVSPEVAEHVPFGEPQKPPVLTHEVLKASSVSPEIQKHASFADPQKALPGSPEKQRQGFFAELSKGSLSLELQKPTPMSSDPKQNFGSDVHRPLETAGREVHKTAVSDFGQSAAPIFSDLQVHSESGKDFFTEQPEGENPFSSLLAPKEQLIQAKEATEEVLFSCPKKKPKKQNQESANIGLNNSGSGNNEMDTSEVKEQESNSDQEQFDPETSDLNKDTKIDLASPTQPQCVLQFTEEKEAFISEEEIAKYMKRGKGKYYCKICCCRAMKKGAVLHHLVNKHNVHSPYKCDICGKAFLLESHLKNHVAAHGQSLLKCPRCSFESNFPRGFKKHLTHCQSRHNEEANKKQMDTITEPPPQSEEANKVPVDGTEPLNESLIESLTEPQT
uniref:Chromosome alignment-maintaining phosphoprotein 1 n=1 Tax=Podarcis muralis TaxID=64176 RepID=A0A670J336_PODMU|nr:chromosome alignment-maintaining phosphoprotein 1 [Podarcis muralis]